MHIKWHEKKKAKQMVVWQAQKKKQSASKTIKDVAPFVRHDQFY